MQKDSIVFLDELGVRNFIEGVQCNDGRRRRVAWRLREGSSTCSIRAHRGVAAAVKALAAEGPYG